MLEVFGSGSWASLGQTARDAAPVLVALVAAWAAFALLSRVFGGSSGKAEGPGFFARVGKVLGAAFTTNWQLTLLATTAFVLSVASGWTTWDGMRNFTGEPVLSFMVTFGIQGVMLIIAWLIGESFASGMGPRRRGYESKMGFVIGSLCFIGIAALIANAMGAFDGIQSAYARSWAAFADKALFLGVGLLVVVALLINQRSSTIEPYLQSAQVMARNAVLWVMFLACMATSVFFSFDSLFSSIFPQDQRKRSADIRASRQVAGVVNDIGALASRRQAEEAEQLFRSPGWTAYEKNLADLSRASQGAELEIERYFVDKMEAHRRSVNEQQERMSNAKSGQAGLLSRKATLADEISRLKGERPSIAADLAEKKTELETRNKNIDAKRVEAMAEERGAEGTLKAGKGPVYRQRKAELDQLQDAIKIQEERVRDAQKRMAGADTRIAQLERELAAVDGDLAKLKGEADTAERRIAVAEQTKAGDTDTPKVDPARVRTAFERAHADFRQEPTVERLSALTVQCSQLQGAMLSTPATKDRVRSIDCDPKLAADAAGRVFALNAGLVTFAQNCVGGAKLPDTGGTDALLAFGRKCLQDSGLPSNDSAEMGARISSIDLNRDDKAHRFVVTWNAFADGNRLAYLALSIAIAIDSLVFMSGLFGANAVRSPLTEVEARGEMSADQLEAIIDGALQDTAHPRATLQAILAGLHPINGENGFTSELVLDGHDDDIGREVRQVLNAAATIGAIKAVGTDKTHYQLHFGLVRYLGLAIQKAPKLNREHMDRKELVSVIGVALLPDPQGNADLVLSEMHPISDAQGFAAETSPFRIDDEAKRRLVINALGAGATVPGAVRRNNEDGRYFVSTDFYKTLLLMRAAAIPAFAPGAVHRRFAGSNRALAGGALASAPPPAIESRGDLRQLEDQTRRDPDHGRTARWDDRGAARGVPPQALPQSPQTPPRPVASVPIIAAAVVAEPATPPPLPAVVPQDVAPARAEPAQQPAPRKPPQSSRLASEIRAEIMRRGGIYVWSDFEIEHAWRSLTDPQLERAVWGLVRRERHLGARVDQEIKALQHSIDHAYRELREEHSDSNYLQVLESEVQKLKRLMPALIMTPSGPYEQIVDEMIRAMRTRGGILEDQAGNGSLGEQELSLLRRLGDHAYQLRGLSSNTADRYERLAQLLDKYREASPTDVWTGGGQPDGPPVT